ncbi:MAG: BlaI/MecI/CopY family transcriptional regulator [Verrucomicrobiaceae bacterium]|nr:MAG: BlaI/MecI/CopY family transcriptional regulator [Verrucomicrobiaceae bacterium]
MGNPGDHQNLSRRERQIMDVIWRLGEATAQEVLENIPEPPSYSAVRALLAILVEKGVLKYGREGRKYVYRSTLSPERAKRSALKRLLATFFENSPEKLVASLLNPDEGRLSKNEIARIQALIQETDGATRKG